MAITRAVCLIQAALLCLLVTDTCAQTAAKPSGPAPAAKAEPLRQLHLTSEPWTGDFDKMLERRLIRIHVPYSRSLYFVDRGRERGIAAEVIRDFERHLNARYAKELGKRPLTIYIVTATRDKLLTDLQQGLADVAVGNLTVTPERLKVVDFVAPDEKLVNIEILVTGPASPAIASLDELSGKTVHVREASSYYASLVALNERFKKEGKARVNLVSVPAALEDEDMLEMMNAGLLQAMVVDDWKAKMWAQVLTKLKVHDVYGIRRQDDGPVQDRRLSGEGRPDAGSVDGHGQPLAVAHFGTGLHPRLGRRPHP
jgi:membrane-bound lytic murein transglycosylase MltF